MSIAHLRILFKYFFFFCIILQSTSSSAAGIGTPYNKIVFFGDSMTDNGNLYSMVFKYMPKSPPYFNGRFSNGYVWSDRVARYFAENYSITSFNYAIGGQTAILHSVTEGFSPYTLLISVNNYLMRTVFRDRSTTLFVIWIGANDYLRGAIDADTLTNDVTDRIKAAVERLIYFGGKNFLIINIPNLAKSPYSDATSMHDILNTLSIKHNAKLNDVVAQIQQIYADVNIQIIDVNQLLDNFFANPNKYNEKYHINIKNLNTSCWQGGYTLGDRHPMNEESISRDLEKQIHIFPQSLNTKEGPKRWDTKELAHYFSSPDLQEAYYVSKRAEEGAKPCIRPSEYFFWDHLHPSADVHMMLAYVFIREIELHYQAA